MKLLLHCLASTALIALGVVIAPALRADSHEQADPGRYFELRVYTTHDGKLDALHDRFRSHTNKLFTKHGMDLIGYWTTTATETQDNTLVYMLAYPDAEARAKSWQGFVEDPEWKQAFAASRQDGPIVSKVEEFFLQPTDYSPIR